MRYAKNLLTPEISKDVTHAFGKKTTMYSKIFTEPWRYNRQ